MNSIQFSTFAVVVTSVCVITSSTVANAQNARRIEIPKTCSNDFMNRGARSNDPGKAVEKVLLRWNRLARHHSYFTFKGAKNPRVQVVVYPNGS